MPVLCRAPAEAGFARSQCFGNAKLDLSSAFHSTGIYARAEPRPSRAWKQRRSSQEAVKKSIRRIERSSLRRLRRPQTPATISVGDALAFVVKEMSVVAAAR